MNKENNTTTMPPPSKNNTLTMEMVEEAAALIKALTPAEAPQDLILLKGGSGLNIMKSDYLSDNTIIVSKRLFDLIYNCGNKEK